MQRELQDERELDRGFYLSREAQVGELRRIYALEGDADRLSAARSSSEQVTDAPQ
jgi:hypothetical protein